MTVEALIFDLDGTIIDTESADFESWREVYTRYGVELTHEMWEKRVGWVNLAMFNPLETLEKLTGKRLSEAEIDAQHEQYMARCASQPLLPGTLAMIQAATAHGLQLGIGSNSDRWWVEHWLRHFGLRDYFKCVFTRDDVLNPKPEPDMYLAVAQCLGVPPERCVVFEDSPVGMQAAISAGIRTIAIPNWLTIKMNRPSGVALTLTTLADLSFEKLLKTF
jgi:HAD superfamily hydrolase (TIGR01509 family)